MKQGKTRREKANALLKFVEEYNKSMDKVPIKVLIQNMNQTINILSRRGVKIRDWDDREKVVHSFKSFGNSVFLFAPKERTEGDADGSSKSPGSE